MVKRTGQRKQRESEPEGDASAAFRCTNPECPLSPRTPQPEPSALLALRDHFIEAAAAIETVIRGLSGAGPEGTPPTHRTPAISRARIEAHGAGFGTLLDFEERVAGLPGVARVTISAVDSEQATLVVLFKADSG
ncbi:MAG: hypothetical protein ACKVT1_15300 [Dehalococcoidia bacterium]